jgi:phenylpropionate dioxygenase-like ring-hydroxylating dioxygenase large terminal subunit
LCLHREGPVLSGCGRGRKLICGKHGWRYDLEGNLLGNKAERGQTKLAALMATERDGQIWVSLGP